jgi:hypothetical protein
MGRIGERELKEYAAAIQEAKRLEAIYEARLKSRTTSPVNPGPATVDAGQEFQDMIKRELDPKRVHTPSGDGQDKSEDSQDSG